jgi:DNA polymerase-1
MKVVGLDAYSLIYRSFHAASRTPNPVGMSQKIFVSLLARLLRNLEADYVIAAADCGASFRTEIDKSYKANRSAASPELSEARDYMLRRLEELQIPIYKQAGYEADDLLAGWTRPNLDIDSNGTSLIREKEVSNLRWVIVSSDKDLAATISDNCSLLLVKNNQDNLLYDQSNGSELFGIVPSRIDEVKALMGDASDNIPGVPGIGSIGAVKILARFDSLQELVKASCELQGDLESKEYNNQERKILHLVRSFKLAQLHRDLVLDIDWDQAVWSQDKQNKLDPNNASLSKVSKSGDEKPVEIKSQPTPQLTLFP